MQQFIAENLLARTPTVERGLELFPDLPRDLLWQTDRKSTRLNSSHLGISYAVFCLKKKNVNRCGRSRHMARKISIRRKRRSTNILEMPETETITIIIIIKTIRTNLSTSR